MDEIDRAQAASDVYTEAAMKSHFAMSAAQHALQSAPRTACEDCGQLIPAGRMKAIPTATRCVPCQTKYERGGEE